MTSLPRTWTCVGIIDGQAKKIIGNQRTNPFMLEMYGWLKVFSTNAVGFYILIDGISKGYLMAWYMHPYKARSRLANSCYNTTAIPAVAIQFCYLHRWYAFLPLLPCVLERISIFGFGIFKSNEPEKERTRGRIGRKNVSTGMRHKDGSPTTDRIDAIILFLWRQPLNRNWI